MTGSLRAYARHRAEAKLEGQSLASVQKAVSSQRIAAAVQPDGKIDFEKADALWTANTASRMRGHSERPAPVVSTASVAHEIAPQVQKINFHVDGQPVDYNSAKTATEIARGALLELQRRKQEGELLPRDEVRNLAAGLIANAKTRLRAVGSNLAPHLIAESDVNAIQTLIDAEIDSALSELCAWKP